jgi:hypothetical protein
MKFSLPPLMYRRIILWLDNNSIEKSIFKVRAMQNSKRDQGYACQATIDIPMRKSWRLPETAAEVKLFSLACQQFCSRTDEGVSSVPLAHPGGLRADRWRIQSDKDHKHSFLGGWDPPPIGIARKTCLKHQQAGLSALSTLDYRSAA